MSWEGDIRLEILSDMPDYSVICRHTVPEYLNPDGKPQHQVQPNGDFCEYGSIRLANPERSTVQ